MIQFHPIIYGLFAIATLASCGGHEAPVADKHATLGGDTVALVGSTPLSSSLVGSVAGARAITPRRALDLLVADELAAQEAIHRGLANAAPVEWPITSALARATTIHIRDAALAAGEPTDAEIAERTEAHWRDLARPPSIHVIHALVFRPRKPKPGEEEHARAVAQKMLEALKPATSPEDFESRANAVPHEGVKIRVERLPAFIADGRNAEGAPSSNVPEFARAAFALTTPGAQSGLVETSFGWHVIRLIDVVPALEVPLEKRREILHDEIIDKRGRDAVEAITQAGRTSTKVEVLPDADALMKSLAATPGP